MRIILIIVCTMLISCKEAYIDSKKIKFNNCLYEYKNKSVDGLVNYYYDEGGKSAEIMFKDGIPNGAWTSFGYEGEIIQIGTYTPVYFNPQFFDSSILRHNIYCLHEGIYFDYYVIAIVKQNAISTFYDTNKIREFIKTEYHTEMKELSFSHGELETPMFEKKWK